MHFRILCRLTLAGDWDALNPLCWELTGSNTPFAEMVASLDVLTDSEEERSRVMDQAFWSGTFLDFSVHAPLGIPSEPLTPEVIRQQISTWGMGYPLVSNRIPLNDRVVYLFHTGSGLGFEWFAALASTKRDVELYYEVMVPTFPGLGVFYYELHTWDCRPGRGPRRRTVVDPPDDLWICWDLPLETRIKPAM